MPKSSFLQNYFGFNKQQRNGLYVLVLISFTLLMIRIAYPYFITPDAITIANLPLEEQKLDSAFENAPKKTYQGKTPTGPAESRQLFMFDPNTVSFAQLVSLGFKEKNAKIFLKFRDRGFVFRKKEDLKKVYGVSDYFYSRLEPYIQITAENLQVAAKTKELLKEMPTQENATKKQSVQALAKVELNAADSITLVGLPGIGPVFAKRIIKYRSLLGGYVALEQLKEVYGFTPELYEKTSAFFSINPLIIKKINLNTAEFKTISRHPYLGYALAKTVCNQQRKTALTPAGLEEMMNDPARYARVLPYLTFE